MWNIFTFNHRIKFMNSQITIENSKIKKIRRGI